MSEDNERQKCLLSHEKWLILQQYLKIHVGIILPAKQFTVNIYDVRQVSVL